MQSVTNACIAGVTSWLSRQIYLVSICFPVIMLVQRWANCEIR